jgi:hypothetical protein
VLVQSYQYDVANQVIGFSNDAAGKLTDDSTDVLATVLKVRRVAVN